MILEKFNNRNIFITGVTGFLGKIILEKILRSIPDVGFIYLLIRSKKDTNPLNRLQSLVKSRIFNRLRSERKDFEEWALKKLICIPGDVSRDKLGMSDNNIKIIQENVNIFIHSAATVNFTERLPDAINLNVLGSLRLFDIARGCKNCECFTHISTAYVNCNKRGTVEEVLYPLDFNPNSTLQELLEMDPNQMEANEDNLIAGYPNTYTFTKSLTEHLLAERRGNIPLLFFRPTIIGACYKEPVPGWLDTVSAASALYVTTGMGIMKFMLAYRPSRIGDQVPADFVSNSLLCATADISMENRLNIIQVGTSRDKPLTWRYVKKTILPYLLKRPPKRTFSKPTFMFVTSDSVYNALYFFQYRVPIASYNLYARFLGTDKQLKEAQLWSSFEKRIRKMVGNFSYFVNNEWIFDTKNTYEVWNKLSDDEKYEFNFDIAAMDWEEYLLAFCYGMRLNILRETDAIYPAEDRNCPMYLRADLGADFFWAYSGSDGVNDIYKINPPESMIPLILNSSNVQGAITKEATEENMSINDVENRAKEILDIMAGSMKFGLLRTQGYFFRKFYRRMYQGIFVDEFGIKRVAKAAKSGPIILIPTHRSYIDFLLTSFVFYDQDLPIPRIAAGDDFLNMAIVSWMFRNSGAFFMRRSNGNDELYRSIFNEYVKNVISIGHPLEFFIEGTRSRTGKSMPPKIGLLSTIVSATLSGTEGFDHVSICPITISYERLVEEQSHAHELAGQPKEKPTTTALIKNAADKLINQNYGRINIQFAEPIEIHKYTQDYTQTLNSKSSFNPQDNPNDLFNLSLSLGNSIIDSFHNEMVMMPTQILCAIIMVYRTGISKDQLSERFGWLRNQLLLRNGRIDPIEGSNEDIIEHCNGLLKGLYTKKRNIIEVEIVKGQTNIHVMQLAMYRNGILHVLQREGIIAITLLSFGSSKYKDGIRMDKFLESHQFLSNFLINEFVDTNRDKEVHNTLHKMEEYGLISIEKQNYEFIHVKQHRSEDDMFIFLCELFFPFIDSIWLTTATLFSLLGKRVGVMERMFIERVQWFGEKSYFEHKLQYFDATSKESIKSVLKVLMKYNIIEMDESTSITLSSQYHNNPDTLQEFIDKIHIYRKKSSPSDYQAFARL